MINARVYTVTAWHMGPLKSRTYGALIKTIYEFTTVRQNYGAYQQRLEQMREDVNGATDRADLEEGHDSRVDYVWVPPMVTQYKINCDASFMTRTSEGFFWHGN
ncbi:uncharacterized protein [Euphorbia lathyris]|uniref:uncharacterized protein isoform X2 n=1 Tax=Euphorbia lathyris TaxID=212925 RepID=UPI003313E5DB